MECTKGLALGITQRETTECLARLREGFFRRPSFYKKEGRVPPFFSYI
jgi:hypothetical protein